MNQLTTVRLDLIGLGNMGQSHARSIIDGKVPGLELTAVADQDAERLEPFKEVAHFNDGLELIKSGSVDAILIATPHYSHTTLGIAALEAGIDTLVEKPISVHKEDCERPIAAWQNKDVVFSAMFNRRNDPAYCKVKSLIESGELDSM